MNNWRKKNKYKDAFKKLSSKFIINKSRNNSNANSKTINNDNNQIETTNKDFREKQKTKTAITFSDKVNLGGVITNAIIAVCTLYALYLTHQSLGISKQSLDLAKKTTKDSDSTSKANFDLTKQSVEAATKLSQFADSNYIVTKKGIESSNKNYEQSFKISEKSFNETVSQFNKSNTPYIQIEEVALNDIKEGSQVFVNYKISNLTNIPVKIIKQRGVFKIDKVPADANEIKSKIYQTQLNQYLIKDAVIDNKAVIINEPITKDFFDYINHKENYIYLAREIVYENLITKKIRHYIFQIKLKRVNTPTVQNNTYIEYVYNENYDE